MNHQHLPALNRYTSPQQYEALKQVQKTKSLTPLLMKGSMSKTVGSLIRNAWITANNYTDKDGVLREGCAINDAGKHAMSIYEAKMAEAEKIEKARQEFEAQKKQKQREFYETCKDYYRAQLKADKLKQQVQLMAGQVYDSMKVAEAAIKFITDEAKYKDKMGIS